MEKEKLLQYLQKLQERAAQKQGYVARMEYIATLKNLVDNNPNCLLELLPDLKSMPDKVIEYITELKCMKMKGRLIEAIIKNINKYQEYSDRKTRSFSETALHSLFQMRKGLTSILKLYAEMGLWMNDTFQQLMLQRLSRNHLPQILTSYLKGKNRMELWWELQVYMLNMPNAEDAIRKYYKKTGRLHYQAKRVAQTKGWI